MRRLGGIQVALSAVRDQTQQVAVVAGPVADPEASVVAAEVVFHDAGWRPAFDLVAGRHPSIERVLVERGFTVVASRPGMVRSLRSRPGAVTDAPAVVDRARRADRVDIAAIHEQAFGLDPDTALGMVPEGLFDDPDVVLLVARSLDGVVVGSVTVHVDDTVAAVVGAAVAESARRRGIGSALTVAASDTARERGAGLLWLQASDQGRGLYAGLGFDVVADCQVWLR